ncbi:hypothetical protein [Ancylobacter sp. FA202]|uniref:hypothetical protein n=1 Tax=Ancylobacter sp. FA202 TaxID=1111106 RepID=UPI00036364CC|nr:hypothetical protein [Ancylobacter sp. FA202]
MIYTEEILDRRTGELITINKGDWITVTEFGQAMGVGPRKVRSVLRELDFVGVEGGGTHQRHRMSSWAVRQGLGRRIEPRRKGAAPFDVISPAGQAWLRERWADALAKLNHRGGRGPVAVTGAALREFQVSSGRENMPVQEAVCWLSDHFPRLTQEDMAVILDVTQQLVSRYRGVQAKQRKEAREWAEATSWR